MARGRSRGGWGTRLPFPDSEGLIHRRRELRAKAVCAHCAVRGEGLDYALSIRGVHGIWGGTSEVERRRMIGLIA
ncbi:MAG: WhiB family transcriptional regulator [Acidimicrobiales bacterium]|nr:WhiB family transcriptional regulator [Acidimicrobiales bacterium]